MHMGWDTKDGKIIYFLRPTDFFFPDSIELLTTQHDGVEVAVGKPIRSLVDVKERYKILFDASKWTLQNAQKFVDDHNLSRYLMESEKEDPPVETNTPTDKVEEPAVQNAVPTPKEKEEDNSEPPTPTDKVEEPPANNPGVATDLKESSGVEVDLKEEFVELSEGTSIDEEKGIIKGAAIIRLKSRNGYDYTEEALTEAMPLFEDARVYLDHTVDSKPRVRSVKDLAGKITKVRPDKDAGGFLLRGDVHVAGSSRQHLMEMAKTIPDKIGLSPHTIGLRKDVGGKPLIVKIGQVFSVDVVTTPGTTVSLFESQTDQTQVPDQDNEKKDTQVEKKTMPENADKHFKLSELNIAFLSEHCSDVLKEARQDLHEENCRLRTQVEEFVEKDRVRDRELLIEKTLQEAQVKRTDCNEIFFKQLREAHTPLEVQQLVADRKALLRSGGSKPVSVEQPTTLKESSSFDYDKPLGENGKMSPEEFKRQLVGAVRGK